MPDVVLGVGWAGGRTWDYSTKHQNVDNVHPAPPSGRAVKRRHTVTHVGPRAPLGATTTTTTPRGALGSVRCGRMGPAVVRARSVICDDAGNGGWDGGIWGGCLCGHNYTIIYAVSYSRRSACMYIFVCVWACLNVCV